MKKDFEVKMGLYITHMEHRFKINSIIQMN